jgi:hypothetical protein
MYPTKEQIQEEIAKLTLPLRTNPGKYAYLEEMKIIIDNIENIFKTDQLSLCNSLGKGVYYNFVCRYKGKLTNNIYNYNSGVENSKGIFHSVVKGMEKIEGENKEKNRALLLNRIGEAETKRKRLIANYYTSKNYKQKQKPNGEKQRQQEVIREYLKLKGREPESITQENINTYSEFSIEELYRKMNEYKIREKKLKNLRNKGSKRRTRKN